MLSLRPRRSSQQGFTLTEIVIVLGVIGIVAAGLWRLMSTANQQSKDNATAQQQAAVITAVKGYLADISANSGQTWLTSLGGYSKTPLPLPSSNSSVANCQAAYGGTGSPYAALCNFLPTGITSASTNPYGQKYTIQVLKDGNGPTVAPSSYSFMIMANANGVTIPDGDGGRIAGLIGGDGGFVYTAAVCNAAASTYACGALGGWSSPVSNYGFNGTYSGSIASRTFVSSTASDYSNFWLGRVHVPGGPFSDFYNTMTVDLFMGLTSGGAATNINFLQNGAPTTGGITMNGGIFAMNNSTLTGNGTGTGAVQMDLVVSDMNTFVQNQVPLVKFAGKCTTNNNPAVTTATYVTNCPATLEVDGDITAAGVLYQSKNISTSDARLKTDIRVLQDPLTDLMKIDAVSFRYKNGTAPSMGVIAQNVEKTYPQLVTEHQGIKYVEYNGLIGPLIGSVQELKHENEELRAALTRAENRETRLEHMIEDRRAAR